MIHIGIIETGHPADAIVQRYGSYPHMFRGYFAGRSDMDFYSFSVLENQPLPSARKCDGWLITGSKAAIYESHPWIPRLLDLIRETQSFKIPMLGICFGHQAMAVAMGGVVERSIHGRGIGVQQYDLTAEGQKVIGQETLRLNMAHEDQVTRPPPGGRLLATSAFCKYASFAYDQCGLSLQGHPEFSAEYERELIVEWQKEKPIDPAIVERAMKSLDTTPLDSQTIAPILGKFLARQLAL